MLRKLKAIGLTFFAAFAIGAVVASAASATPAILTAEGKSITATGEQVGEHVLLLTNHPLVGGGFASAKCKKEHFDGIGTMTDGATTVTVTPTLSECTAFGQPATINHNECKYVFHFGTPTPTGAGWHVKTAAVCPAGKAILIQTATCEVTIGSQELPSTSEVTNAGGAGTAMDLLLHTNLTGLKYTVVKDGIGCPLSGLGEFSKGDYTGTTTLKGLSAVFTPVGITLDDPPSSGLGVATGEQVAENAFLFTDHLFGGQPVTAKCKKANLTATEAVEVVEEELRVHPELSECTAFGQPATITTTNCDYLFHIGSPTAAGWHITTDVVCSGGAVIKIATATCEVTIGAQNGLTTSEVTNSGTEESMDILLHTSITGIHYTVVKDNIGCPLSGLGEFSKGDYTGTTTVKAHDSGSSTPADITVEPPPSDLIATGEQVGENELLLTDHLISGQPASVKCNSMNFTGSEPLPEGLETVKVHPEYKECTAFGLEAAVTTTNCDYFLHVGSPTAGGWRVTTDVACGEGSALKIVAGNCEVTIGAQKGLTTSEIENSGTEENMDMLLHTNIAGVHYTVAKDGSGCPLSGTGNFSQGDYTGTTTVGAHDSKTLDPVGLTKS